MLIITISVTTFVESFIQIGSTVEEEMKYMQTYIHAYMNRLVPWLVTPLFVTLPHFALPLQTKPDG